MSQEKDGGKKNIINEERRLLNDVSLILKNVSDSNFLLTQKTTCIDLCGIDVLSSIPEKKLIEYEMCIRKFNKLHVISKENSQAKIQWELLPRLSTNFKI